jgi:hypothetical protein
MKTSLFALTLLFPAVGCMSIKPIGPLADKMGTPRPDPKPPNATVMAPKDISAMPTIEEGPRPPRPAYEVTPGEVSESNAQDCVTKLKKELELDRISADAMPRYPEVSRVKR